MVPMFDWHRFIAIQLRIFVLVLIYQTATELNHLFGEGELWHLLVTSRPSELPLNRRHRILELVRLSKLADAHSIEEFRDLTTIAHIQLVDIVHRIAREPTCVPRWNEGKIALLIAEAFARSHKCGGDVARPSVTISLTKNKLNPEFRPAPPPAPA
jgi:hypothetical protein